MAGSGRRVFTPGEVLTASNTMNYLMDQAVMNFAGTAARGSAIGTAVAEGMVSYLADSNLIEVYDGSAWKQFASTSGSILQVVQTIKTDTYSQSGSSWADVTGMSVTITPKSSSSKVLVMVSSSVGITYPSSQDAKAAFRLSGGNTATYAGDSAGSRTRAPVNYITQSVYVPANSQQVVDMKYLDSPATTSAVTYFMQAYYSSAGGGNLFVNRGYNDSDNDRFNRGVSSIIAMEVAG